MRIYFVLYVLVYTHTIYVGIYTDEKMTNLYEASVRSDRSR